MPICLRLLLAWTRAAASRTFCTAGKSMPMRIAMMAITTNSSISVKPAGFRSRAEHMDHLLSRKAGTDDDVFYLSLTIQQIFVRRVGPLNAKLSPRYCEIVTGPTVAGRLPDILPA